MQGSIYGGPAFTAHDPTTLAIGELREGQRQATARMDRFESQMDELQDQVLVISQGSGGARPSLPARLKGWLELLASLKEMAIWLAALPLGTWAIFDPQTVKALLLRMIGLG
jgi:hypothetical protein